MNKSKILRAVLTAVLTLVATTASYAYDFEVGSIYYSKIGEKEVMVTSGDNKYTGDIEILSSVTYSGTTYPVTSIGNSAFKGCSGLKSVTIPNSVTSIGNYAFYECSGLTSVIIGNSVTSIGDKAFQDCSGLTSVTIPNSVNSIGDNAFNGCSGLTSVSIPNSVTSIDDYAFYYCSGLTSVIIGNSVTSIGKYAFSGCSGLESIIVVESGNSKYDSRDNCNAIIETATNTLLAGCKNTTIPNSVTSIGDNAFNGCSGLTSVTIPNSVTSIGNWAFASCSGLTSVTIPNSVNSIGYSAFQGCSGLTSVTIPNSVTAIGNSAFNSCKGLTSVTIPNSVNSIGFEAFKGCSGLTSVTIPNSVTSIGNSAFYHCSGLTSVTIGNSVTSIGEYAFWGCSGSTTIFYNAENCADVTANSYVFNSGTNIIIGKYVKKVPDYLFYSLTSAPTSVISKSVTPPSCGVNSFNSNAYTTAKLYVPSGAYKAANVWNNFKTIEIEPNDAENVAELIEGANKVNFGLQGVKMHDGVLYACTTAESVNKSTPTLHGNTPDNMDTYEDRNFDEFDQRDWVAIRGLVDGFVGKELSYPFVAQFADGVLTPSETINYKANATAYTLNTFRAENILHGGYSNYAEGAYKAYYVPARVNEVANFMGHIETVGEAKYLYSNNANGRKDGEGIKIEGNIADNSTAYSLMEGILVADASTKAGVKIIMLQDFGEATGVEGVDAAARIYTANGNIIITATEDGEAAVYDFTGRLIKSVPVASGNSTAVPVTPGYYIVKTETKTQSVVVK